MPERMVKANGIDIWCEDFGDPADPALLLVMGAGAQGLLWPDEFCAALAAGGRHVIRYDNRDTGLSTCFDFAKQPYTLADMALDAVGILDGFSVERAHVVGASMGGMIGQTLAIGHRERLRTLTSIMSSPCAGSLMQGTLSWDGEKLPLPEPKVMAVIGEMMVNPPRTPEDRIASTVRLWSVLTGSLEPFNEEAVRERESRAFARAKNPDAAQNHGLAINASPDRLEALRGVTTPTLVIHGSEDPIIPLPHGRAVAGAIPGARLLVIEGMGHDLPPKAVPPMTQALLEHTR